MSNKIDVFMQEIIERNPGEKEFHQAVREVTESIMPYIEKHPTYRRDKILERIA
jgi:glutamate dehydrogenase (NADP+)